MMRILKYFLPVLLAFLCACAANTEPESAWPEATYSKLINTGKFVSRSDLEAPPAVLPQNVKAVIVPHGPEAMPMGAAIMHALAQRNPRTVILLAPNHTAKGPKIATTYAAFAAYDGIVLPDEERIRAVEGRGLAGIDDGLFLDEHSVGAVMPLIARYLPGARVVPLIFQKGASFNTAKQAVETVCDLSDPETVIVASIDFSHGLSPREEQVRRAKMIECIQMYDAAGVLNLDGTYVDAPVVLATLLQMLKDDGCKMEFIASANTAELLGRDVPAATGYMTIVFYREK